MLEVILGAGWTRGWGLRFKITLCFLPLGSRPHHGLSSPQPFPCKTGQLGPQGKALLMTQCQRDPGKAELKLTRETPPAAAHVMQGPSCTHVEGRSSGPTRKGWVVGLRAL